MIGGKKGEREEDRPESAAKRKTDSSLGTDRRKKDKNRAGPVPIEKNEAQRGW